MIFQLHHCSANDVSDLETTFSVNHDAYGELQVHDLKTNGRDILVTEENKKEYVRWGGIWYSSFSRSKNKIHCFRIRF